MGEIIRIEQVQDVLIPFNGQNTIPDFLVAHLYGAETKDINRAVKNNPDKFPEGYVLICDNEWIKTTGEKFSPVQHQTFLSPGQDVYRKGIIYVGYHIKKSYSNSYYVGNCGNFSDAYSDSAVQVEKRKIPRD